jgi:hypothetical protein
MAEDGWDLRYISEAAGSWMERNLDVGTCWSKKWNVWGWGISKLTIELETHYL